jgi:hypothetical protein
MIYTNEKNETGRRKKGGGKRDGEVEMVIKNIENKREYI